jgi:hypothetical protein
MNRKRTIAMVSVLLTLFLSVGGTAAIEPEPADEISITAAVNSRISYQGVLKENGNPVNGKRDMVFRLYSDSICDVDVGAEIVKDDVLVVEGLFNVGLDVNQDHFNGQGLWLEPSIGGVGIACQEIMPAPYALSLRPGAQIIGEQAGSDVLTVENSSPANDSRAIRGYASAGTGFTAGVNGRTDSSNTGAKGVWGYAAGGGQTYGVHGESNSTSGRGVFGRANTDSGTNHGVYGESKSPDGFGGYFLNSSGTGTGVYGKGWIGVLGESTGGMKAGVKGVGSLLSYGVWAVNPENIALYVEGGGSNPTAFVDGTMTVTGSLTKGSGSFKIDHPLEPETKYLYHSFVESPDMMNVYNGNAVLDEDGQAWVELPDWFEALNRDYRYQLTPIGAPGPNLFIAEGVSGNRFKIAGGEPGMQVSWQVTGIRQDPWANANRIQVEEEKPEDEQGYYLHPEVYGQPESQGIGAK